MDGSTRAADPGSAVGARFAAGVIDLIVLLVLPLIVFFALARTAPTGTLGHHALLFRVSSGHTVHYVAGGRAGALLLIWLAWWLTLGLVIPAVTGGSTPGMLVCGLRTVGLDGGAVSVGRHLVRTLLWVVDGFPYLIPGLLAFIVILVTPAKQRVGDLAAQTTVTRR